MKIEQRDITKVLPYARNPRKNDAAVASVASSIKEFGWRQPIVIDSEGVIVAGHTRWKAAQQLGLEKVPVHVATDLSEAQIRAYRILDNRSHENASWDDELLPLELADLKDLGLDLALTGFTAEELNELLAPARNDGQCDPDAVPEPPDDPVTKRGDLWILGQHRLLCGDSASEADVDRLLDGAAIHLVNTDPPYNVKVEPRSNNAIAAGLSSYEVMHHQDFDVARHPEKSKPTTRKMRAKDRPLANDHVSDEQFREMLHAWFRNIARVLLPGRGFYIWGGYSNLANYPPVLEAHDLYFSQGIVWDKQHPVLGRKDFLGAFELGFYGWRLGAAHVFLGPNNVPDLWSIKKINPQATCHLTQKPVALAVKAIECSTRPGENVLDLFAGSGSTLIGCEQSGRRCYTMEIDPLYADVVIERWQAFTCERATHAETGAPFPKAPPAQREAMQ